MIKKKIISILVVYFLVLIPIYAEQCLTIVFYSGETYSILLSDNPEVTFEGNDFIVNGTGVSMSFLRNEIKEFHFEENTTSIDTLSLLKMKWISNKIVQLYGSNIMSVKLYDLKGQERAINIVKEQDMLRLSMESVEAGIYILKIDNNKSIKIKLR